MKKTRFTEMLISANRLDADDFRNWAFCSGMRFNSPYKWWGDRGRRDFPHEGIDFCLYQDRTGQILHMGQKTCIPVMHDGVVRAVFTDYLGQAVIIEHGNIGDSGPYLSAYAHTAPLDAIQPGHIVKEGDIIATVADTSSSKAKILPHLHFSFGRPSPDVVYETFVWNTMRDSNVVDLLNPLSLIDWPCRVLDRQTPDCMDLL